MLGKGYIGLPPKTEEPNRGKDKEIAKVPFWTQRRRKKKKNRPKKKAIYYNKAEVTTKKNK